VYGYCNWQKSCVDEVAGCAVMCRCKSKMHCSVLNRPAQLYCKLSSKFIVRIVYVCGMFAVGVNDKFDGTVSYEHPTLLPKCRPSYKVAH